MAKKRKLFSLLQTLPISFWESRSLTALLLALDSAQGLSTIPLWTAQRRMRIFFGRLIMRAKYRIYLTPEERRIVINSLIDLRNNLISQGMYTDLVDELLIRISKAKAKKIKIKGG